MTSILALGLDPVQADLSAFPGVTPQAIRAFVEAQIDRLRQLGFAVETRFVDGSAASAAGLGETLDAHAFDCVLIGAGLRDPAQLALFERVINLVHRRAPGARIGFNRDAADTVDAVKRSLGAGAT